MISNKLYLKSFVKLIALLTENFFEIEIIANAFWANNSWNTTNMKAFEIAYIVEGSILITVDKSNYKVNKGDFYFTDLVSRYSSQNSSFKIFFITFTTQNDELYQKLKSCYKNLVPYIYNISQSGLGDYFIKLSTEYYGQNNDRVTVFKNELIGLLIKIYKYFNTYNYSQRKTGSSNKNELLVHEIIEYLNANYSRKIMLKELSKKYPIGKRYLNIVFRNVTKYSIIQYLIKIRVEKAKILLRETQMNVTEIAQETGFCDTQHFCKSFKSVEGMTSSEFRKVFH